MKFDAKNLKRHFRVHFELLDKTRRIIKYVTKHKVIFNIEVFPYKTNLKVNYQFWDGRNIQGNSFECPISLLDATQDELEKFQYK